VLVSDLIPERLAAAKLLGADATVNPAEQDIVAEMRKLWSLPEAEFVIDAVGSAKTKVLSLDLLEPASAAVWLGLHENRITIDSYALTLPQKSVSGSYSGSMDDFRKAVELLESGVLNTSWVSQYPLENGEAAFRAMMAAQGSNIKAVLQIDGSHA
jgi:threonine dehydrogenase-like Zn-dependent dehydrogenase